MTLNAFFSPDALAKDPSARQTQAVAMAESHHANLLYGPMENFMYEPEVFPGGIYQDCFPRLLQVQV